MESYTIVGIAVVMALSLTYVIRSFAIKHRIGTVPDLRKVHAGFIPQLGGLGIYLGALAGIAFTFIWKDYYWHMFTLKYAGILAGATLMLITGIVDDVHGLSARQKFLIQVIASTIVIYSGCRIETIINPFGEPLRLGYFSIPLTYLWLIGVTNAINLLDGLDGLAAGVSLIALATFSILAFQQQDWMTFGLCLAFIGGILGFLYYNYHPASIFMGDTGSLFLGFLIAALAVKGLQKSEGNIALLVPIITLAVPIGDTILAFFRRLNKGQHPFNPDKDHLHHRLLFLGLSHRQAVHIIYLFSLLFGVAAYLIATETGLIGALVVLVIFLTAVFSLYRLGYTEAQKIKTYIGDRSIIRTSSEKAPLSMRRFWHKLLLIVSDTIMLNLALLVTYLIRFHSGLFESTTALSLDYYITSGVWLLLTSLFVILYILNGLYNMRWYLSRFDQILRVTRVSLFTILILFIATLEPGKIFTSTRWNILIYAGLLIIFVNAGRMLIIYFEKKKAALEYAQHNTLLVGSNKKALKLLNEISNNPHLLYRVVGVVAKETPLRNIKNLPYLGNYKQISKIIRDRNIEEVIIALDDQSPDEILDIVAQGELMRISFKVIPEMYDVISGLKTEEILGHPLIRLFPEHMLPWQWLLKRITDFLLAGSALVLLSPLFLLVLLLQMVDGVRPIFIIEDRIGRYGKIFGLVFFNRGKNRPELARFLTRGNIYRIPHFLNVLIGSLSIVGPKPETRETIDRLRTRIRFYNRRFMIRPGITGWAQLKVPNLTSAEIKAEQFRQDLFYMENMSLSFDLRIVVRAMVKFLTPRRSGR
jgi:UDP-GlcNAc:undecaprenyl-phosphate GlcNAc-1-phosphate transferase